MPAYHISHKHVHFVQVPLQVQALRDVGWIIVSDKSGLLYSRKLQ